MNAWRDFQGTGWQKAIDVRDFILSNFQPYTGNEQFLAGPSAKTTALMDQVRELLQKEQDNGGVLDVDTETVSSLTHYAPGYIDPQLEVIVGLQTDAPLKRGIHPFGGIRMATQSCQAYGYTISPRILKEFQFRTTHNDGVFRAYSDEMKQARHLGLITGLPDAYGRGRIIGDYRRVALYGVDALIRQKQDDKAQLSQTELDEPSIKQLEELYQQISFLNKLKEMAAAYGFDISGPAVTATEAVQWVYFAYLGAIKEQNGAAMSLGRVSTFLDCYFERDLREGTLTEEQIQECIDQFVIKLRCARLLRTPDYNELFGGDPMWITEVLGGMANDGRTLVTKTSFRMLHTLINLGSAPEPNLTVLWSSQLPEAFQRYCAHISITTDSIQYENDDLMRPQYGDDYGIACCVSAMQLGKQMQYFGARCNLAKLLLLAINGGKEEHSRHAIGPQMPALPADQPLNYTEVSERFQTYMAWMAGLYVNTMNVIHYMHDKYAYEKLQMALHDTNVERLMAFGIAGLSVVADSLSAIKYAKVTPRTDEKGNIIAYEGDGDFPKYGNDDDRVDEIAKNICAAFIQELRKHKPIRNAIPTLSVLTITSNVVYGSKTGATPDGRQDGEPFAPGANPMHKREENGAVAALNSVAKIDYEDCRDGISNTFSLVPDTLGTNAPERIVNLVSLLNGYFAHNAHHLNVNVLNKETLIDAYHHPEQYPNLTIRVSGYAVHFHRLSQQQQLEVIERTFHTSL